MSESRIQEWLADDVELISTITVDIHEVFIVRFDGDDLLYGLIDLPHRVICLYGRDEKELRQAFESAMGIEVSRVKFIYGRYDAFGTILSRLCAGRVGSDRPDVQSRQGANFAVHFCDGHPLGVCH